MSVQTMPLVNQENVFSDAVILRSTHSSAQNADRQAVAESAAARLSIASSMAYVTIADDLVIMTVTAFHAPANKGYVAKATTRSAQDAAFKMECAISAIMDII